MSQVDSGYDPDSLTIAGFTELSVGDLVALELPFECFFSPYIMRQFDQMITRWLTS